MSDIHTAPPARNAAVFQRNATVIQTLAPGSEAVFTIDTEAQTPGAARFRAEVVSSSLKQPVRAEEPTRIMGRESKPYNR